MGERWYRGKLLLVAQGDKLFAVNYVNLKQYLASVVGSEMSAAAPLEALESTGDCSAVLRIGTYIPLCKLFV